MKSYAQIALRRSIFGKDNFTFEIPEKLQKIIKIGQIVEVPLKNSIKKGLVFEISEEKPNFETREILRPLTPELLSQKQIELIKFISEEYLTPISRIIPMFLTEKTWNSDGLPPANTLLELNIIPEKVTGKKQIEVINYLKTNGLTEISILRNDLNISMSVISKMLDKGIIKKSFRSLYQEEIADASNSSISAMSDSLTKDQKAVFERLQKTQKCLLYGPTGAGKSLIIRLLTNQIIKSGQALILAPEIAITQELYNVFAQLFDRKLLAIFHSKMSENEKYQTWWKIKTGTAKIILGSRSALFLPFKNLKLIALEEEHDSSYKNDQSPRYATKNVAGFLANNYKAKLIFSSATPSLETYYSAEQKEIELLEIQSRFSAEEKAITKKVEIVDIKDELLAKNSSPISRKLENRIAEVLAKNKKIILFLNRRGYYSAAVCKECGTAQKCPHCSVSLTHHKQNNKDFLLCHHCSRIYFVPAKCGNCQGTQFVFFGFGTQQVEEIIKKKFPEAKIIRADSDTTKTLKTTEKTFDEFFRGKAQILIGTQIVAKGYDNENVALVGIILADTSLQIPDFRAAEKTFQNLVQVIGRTGRKGSEGNVIIQTFLPEHFAITTSANEDFMEFYKNELETRKKFTLPPFTRILKIIFKHPNKELAFRIARKEAENLQKHLNKDEQLFVAPALVTKKHGKFHVNIFIHTKDPKRILRKYHPKGAIIDIDPVDNF